MQIIDLNQQYVGTFYNCLEDWSDEIKEAGDHKQIWYDKMKTRGLRVKIAVQQEKACGMIQYAPIEHSYVNGQNLYFIYCIWVHGYKNKGIGNFQKKGIGKSLLQAAEQDVMQAGAKGICAWGVSLPFWMKASWFKKQGYKKVDKDGMAVLLWKRFADDAIPPRWIKQKKSPQKIDGKVTVTAFINGWCPAQSMILERAKRAAAEFGDRVVFKTISTFEKEIFNEWGISDALFIDDKQISTGPPPSYEKIRKKIAGRVRRLK